MGNSLEKGCPLGPWLCGSHYGNSRGTLKSDLSCPSEGPPPMFRRWWQSPRWPVGASPWGDHLGPWDKWAWGGVAAMQTWTQFLLFVSLNWISDYLALFSVINSLFICVWYVDLTEILIFVTFIYNEFLIFYFYNFLFFSQIAMPRFNSLSVSYFWLWYLLY